MYQILIYFTSNMVRRGGGHFDLPPPLTNIYNWVSIQCTGNRRERQNFVFTNLIYSLKWVIKTGKVEKFVKKVFLKNSA